MRPRTEPRERFLAKVNIGEYGKCWLWNASLSTGGYGQFTAPTGGNRVKNAPAHRFSWELYNGPIPSGKHILHKCDTRHCVNPEHLFVGTHQQNMQDRDSKGRQAKGARSGLAKLCDEKILAIRSRYKLGETQTVLASVFGVNQTKISDIVTRKTWKHV
jgi:hypothetical protein